MLNDFEKMCKSLNECKNGCNDNLYVCAEKAVKKYVGKDRKMLLQLKAQAEGGDFYSYSALMVAIGALLISFTDAILFVPETGIVSTIAVLSKIVIIVVLSLYAFCKISKYHNVLKWRKYILVAITEAERKWK